MNTSPNQSFFSRIQAIPETEAFAEDVARFKNQPTSSLLSARSRAFLAHLIALAKPQSVL
jgi:hypothetical protein